MSFSDDDEYDVLSMKDITSFSPRKTTDVDDEIENRKNKNYHKQHGHHLTKEEQLIMSSKKTFIFCLCGIVFNLYLNFIFF